MTTARRLTRTGRATAWRTRTRKVRLALLLLWRGQVNHKNSSQKYIHPKEQARSQSHVTTQTSKSQSAYRRLSPEGESEDFEEEEEEDEEDVVAEDDDEDDDSGDDEVSGF